MAHMCVTLVHRNSYDKHISDMPLEVYKASSTKAVTGVRVGFGDSFCRTVRKCLFVLIL